MNKKTFLELKHAWLNKNAVEWPTGRMVYNWKTNKQFEYQAMEISWNREQNTNKNKEEPIQRKVGNTE